MSVGRNDPIRFFIAQHHLMQLWQFAEQHGAVVGRRKLARIASRSSASADPGAIFGDLT